MSTLTIGQVAERTGFSASSLRYYEGIGLVAPAGRTDAGYRLYDEATVTRLSFIARAKQLGCTLEEIRDLVDVWEDDTCGPVQRRFHQLVTAKVAATQARLVELTAFADQLRTAAAHLAGPAADGVCDATCACLAELPAAAAPATARATASGPTSAPSPVVCTLPAGDVADRTAEWGALLVHATDRTSLADGGVRLALDAATPVDELVRLVTAEQGCCAFLSFAVTVDGRGLALEVRAPTQAASVLDALFGAAA
jgi:DNA-binding transcriptional MerR regulator